MRVIAWLLLLPLVLVSLLACVTTSGGQKSTRTVMLNGAEVPVEKVAKERYDSAIQKREAGEFAAAEAELKIVLDDYKDASWADFATVALARVYIDTDRPKQGETLLENLLLKKPRSEAADNARYTLALAQLAQGKTDKATPTLESIVDKLPSQEEKRAASLKLAEELFSSGQYGEAARYLARGYNLSSAAEQAELEPRLIALIDSSVPFAELRRIKETDAKPGTFLDELLTFKLARVYLHLRDEPRAAEQTARYLEQYPAGRYAKDARALNEALQKRVQVTTTAIGVILPLTGQYKDYGKRALTAIRIGAGLDARTGAGAGVKLFVKDSAGDPKRAAAAVRELVEEDHVIAIIGDVTIDASLPVSLGAEDFSVPCLSLSRRDGLPELGKWTYRLAFTPKKQAQALAQVAMEGLGMKRFGILYPRHNYGLEFMNAFWDEIDARKGEVTAIESYAHDQTTFTAEAKSLVGRLDLASRGSYLSCRAEARGNPDPYRAKKALERCRDDVNPIVDFEALLIPDDLRTVSWVVPALEAEDILITTDAYRISAYRKTTGNRNVRPVKILLGSLGDPEQLQERIQSRQADGSLIVQGYNDDDQTQRNKKFRANFVEVHRSGPTMLEAHARDAGALLAELASGKTVPAPSSRDEMRLLLDAVEDFPGVTGLIRFDKRGDSATTPMFFKLEKGRLEVAEKSDLQSGGS